MIYFFCTLYPQTPQSRKKRENARKSPRNCEISGARSHDVFSGFTIWLRGGIFHCPLENTAAALRKFFARAAPCFLPCRAPFFRHQRRSRSKPTPSSSGGRSVPPVPTDKKKKDANASFFLVGLLHRKRYERIFEKSACDKAFSSFFINPYCLTCSGCDTFSFFVRTEKDIR